MGVVRRKVKNSSVDEVRVPEHIHEGYRVVGRFQVSVYSKDEFLVKEDSSQEDNRRTEKGRLIISFK